MSGSQAGTVLFLLLACFAWVRGASKARGAIGKRVRGQGDSILDEVVLSVDARHRVRLHDPRKVTASALTPALTWGVFGLITGGVQGLGVWAVAGAICGGLFGYYFLSRLTKDQRRGIGEHLPAGSSALAAFVQGPDPRRILAAAAPSAPTVASVAAIGPDLSAGCSAPMASRRNRPGGQAPSAGSITGHGLVQFEGEHSARQALAATTQGGARCRSSQAS
jgi:uncharacterized membrane protein